MPQAARPRGVAPRSPLRGPTLPLKPTQEGWRAPPSPHADRMRGQLSPAPSAVRKASWPRPRDKRLSGCISQTDSLLK